MIRRNFLKLAAGLGLSPIVRASAQILDGFNIFFEFESSELGGEARKLIDKIAEHISPRGRATITGNCDGAEREPEKLGFARANAVLTHLLRRASMAKVRFNVVNHGATRPLVHSPPNTPEPRNRRVVIIVDR